MSILEDPRVPVVATAKPRDAQPDSPMTRHPCLPVSMQGSLLLRPAIVRGIERGGDLTHLSMSVPFSGGMTHITLASLPMRAGMKQGADVTPLNGERK